MNDDHVRIESAPRSFELIDEQTGDSAYYVLDDSRSRVKRAGRFYVPVIVTSSSAECWADLVGRSVWFSPSLKNPQYYGILREELPK